MLSINPAFHRHPGEAAMIGRLLAAFGELELSVCMLTASATNMFQAVMKALYRLRMTSGRIDAADALLRPFCDQNGLITEYLTAMAMVRHSLKIRNQFAHCNWGDHEQHSGLFFADLQDSAEAETGFDFNWRHVDFSLLSLQEEYFAGTLEWLRFVDHELAVRQGRLQSHWWPKPPEQAQPPMHNPPEQHVPPWLTEDLKALHVARARAAKGGAPTPTPAQQALDKARAEKRAKRQSDRDQTGKKAKH